MQSTPMLKQYHALKAQHQDCILFFRLGDFYEMFYEDATAASRILDLVLTARGKTTANRIPMCGFPHHAAPGYISKLIQAGCKVAICEQVEDPALAKGIVKRDVTRIITSGTYLDENSTDTRYLLCLTLSSKSMGLAFIDPANGTIQTNQYPVDLKKLIDLISTLSIYECVYPESCNDEITSLFNNPLLKSKNISLSPLQDWSFNPDIARKTLCEHFKVANLHGFGIDGLTEAMSSSGALLQYLKQMNKQPLAHIDKISLYANEDYVFISPAAYRGLELDSLIKTLDHTITPLGKRLFRYWMNHPLKSCEQIKQRQQTIKFLKENTTLLKDLKALLNKIPDIEKNISRLSCGYRHAKDLLAIRNALALLPEFKTTTSPLNRHNSQVTFDDIPQLRQLLLSAINEDIPLSKPEGKTIKPGYHPELDELRSIQENGRQWLKKLQEEEIKRTGINSLKIGFNHVFGYYIEITKTQLKNVPEDFIRKQTLANAERYITPKLKEYEEKILTAQDKILKIEDQLIREIQTKILDESLALHHYCQTIAQVDVFTSLSVLAQSPNYIIPDVCENHQLEIKEGRHPVVERMMDGNFIANDTLLDCNDNHLIILTGPNMAGKSTYIRQTAILTILAQVGSFIPAASATIGIVDKIFTRIGAHDDISKGQSTFMVEMNETADILNNLSERSLVILDEIGRGTSTFDGLSLAWALAEHLHSTRVRTLFATHFHEITSLADEKSGIKNYNVAVKKWNDEIVFLHKIIPGSTDDSYGIYVAKLAGIPGKVIERAKKILDTLEKNTNRDSLGDNRYPSSALNAQHSSNAASVRFTIPDKQLDLFTQDSLNVKLAELINQIDINTITPLIALNELQKLKTVISENESNHVKS